MKLTYLKTPLNKYTFAIKPIREWVENNSKGKVLNLFAGKTKLNLDEFRVDQDETMIADWYGDAYDKKIIEETLRAVLPNISLGVPTSQYGFGYNDAIKEIKNKAKKLYNLDL